MTADDARKLTAQNSKRMQYIYDCIQKSANRGNTFLHMGTSECSTTEIDILKSKGFEAGFENHEIDDAQYVKIKW